MIFIKKTKTNTFKKRSPAVYLGQSLVGGNALNTDPLQNILKSILHSLPRLHLPLKGTETSLCRPHEETADLWWSPADTDAHANLHISQFTDTKTLKVCSESQNWVWHLVQTHMFDILHMDSGQVSELQAVLLTTGRLLHPHSPLMKGQLMPCSHQRVWQSISDSTDSLGVTTQQL